MNDTTNRIFAGAIKIGHNSAGQDYTCSAINGRFHLLEQSLEAINFNKEKDRLICLGNIFSPDSESRLAHMYLAEKWFMGVRGWQEHLLFSALITSYHNNEMPLIQWNALFGSSFIDDAEPETLLATRQALFEWPYMAATRNPLSGISTCLMNRELPANLSITDFGNICKGLKQKEFAQESFDSIEKSLLAGMEIDLLDIAATKNNLFQKHWDEEERESSDSQSAIFAMAYGDGVHKHHEEMNRVIVTEDWPGEEHRFNTARLTNTPNKIEFRKVS